MQKSLSHTTDVFLASRQVTFDDGSILETHLKAKKLRAKAFANVAKFIADVVVSLFAGIVKWFNSRAQKNRAMYQLYSMDDRSLADIGIARGDIEAVLNGTGTHEPFQPSAINVQVMKNTKTNKSVVVQDDTRIAA